MAAGEKIIQLPSGSIADTSLGLIGDPSTGALSKTTYAVMKAYFQQGLQVSINTGSLATTASLNAFTASYSLDSSSFNTSIASLSGSQGKYLQTASFNNFSGSYVIDSSSFDNRITITSSSLYTLSASYHTDSASFNSRIGAVTGSNSFTSSVLNFIVGDGQSFTPANSSTVFSSSLLINKTIIQFQQEGGTIAPISRSVAWYSITSSIGKINLNNTSFLNDVYYSIIYT